MRGLERLRKNMILHVQAMTVLSAIDFITEKIYTKCEIIVTNSTVLIACLRYNCIT